MIAEMIASSWMEILWKLNAIVAVGWGMHAVLRWRNPRWRVLAWRVVGTGALLVVPVAWWMPAVKLAILPAAAMPVEIPTESLAANWVLYEESPSESIDLSLIPNSVEPIAEPSPRIPIWWIAWIGGALLSIGRYGLAHWRMRRLLRSSIPAPDWVQATADRIAGEMGLCASVPVRQASGSFSPFLTGLRRSMIVLPNHIATSDYAEDLPSVFTHEIAHVVRGDLAWMGLLRWVGMLAWFHPLAWRMGMAHNAACERVCDAMAADALSDTKAYSYTLARLALEFSEQSAPVVAVPMAHVADVRRRLEALRPGILNSPLNRIKVWIVILIGVVVVALVGGVQLVEAQ